MAIPNDVAQVLRGYKDAILRQQQQIAILHQLLASGGNNRPLSVQEEIDRIEGRRMEGTLSGEISFTADDLGQRAAPITMNVSQDGPFVMTHYPMCVWRPSAPDNAANLGRWRPISTFPLPDQVVDTDIIDILYELQDGGNSRLLQNEPRGPLLSRPDNIVPCPIPTLWSPNSVVLFIPTYLAMTWDGSPAPTAGILHVDIPGYRIVNM
jgi:hypothetical protein